MSSSAFRSSALRPASWLTRFASACDVTATWPPTSEGRSAIGQSVPRRRHWIAEVGVPRPPRAHKKPARPTLAR